MTPESSQDTAEESPDNPIDTLDLSVVVPLHNEQDNIGDLLRRLNDSLAPLHRTYELMFVDDGSTDGSRELLRDKFESRGVRVLLHERNQGKGAALRTGFAAATREVVIVQDADLEYDPKDYVQLIEPIAAGRADVVFGSRFAGGEPHRVLYFWHSLVNHGLTLLSNMLTNLNLTDMEVCYKVFRREVLEQIEIEENRFGFEPEITAKVAKLGCRIYEVGVSYSGRTYEEGKKIGFRDGLWAVWCILKYNLRR